MKFLILFIIFSSSYLFSQDVSTKDSTDLRLQIRILIARLNQLEKLNDSLAQFNNKLIEENYDDKNRILQYRIKDDFFANAFSEQTVRFTIIISFITLMLVIFVVYSYNFQTKRLNENFGTQILTQKTAFTELQNRIENLEFNMDISLGNISGLLSEFHLKNANPFLAIKYALIAARYIYLATQIKTKKDKDNNYKWTNATILLLNIANDNLKKIDTDNQSYRDAFRIQQDEFIEQLNELTKAKNDDINDIASSIKLKIKNIAKI